jgi:hypothetical protein
MSGPVQAPASHWFVHPDGPHRRWVLFALRDDLPLDEQGWTVAKHTAGCGMSAAGLACQEDGPCFATRVQFIPLPYDDLRGAEALHDLSAVIAGMVAQAPPTGFPLIAQPNFRWVAAVSSPMADEPYVGNAIDLIHDSLAALRITTGFSIPSFSVERVWPTYLIATSTPTGEVEVMNVVLVEHGQFGPPRPATADEKTAAQDGLFHRWRGSPLDTYLDFAQVARASAWQDGDYTKAVTSAAVAAEVIIKHAAWMLTFEASAMSTDPAPSAPTHGLGEAKPSKLIGDVLAKRLGGNWSSKDRAHPVGAWREDIARMRSRVLHLGHRPSVDEARAAVAALDKLQTHISDRLAAKATVYPRTALTLIAPGLARRGVSIPTVPTGDRYEWLADYLRSLTADPDPEA